MTHEELARDIILGRNIAIVPQNAEYLIRRIAEALRETANSHRNGITPEMAVAGAKTLVGALRPWRRQLNAPAHHIPAIEIAKEIYRAMEAEKEEAPAVAGAAPKGLEAPNLGAATLDGAYLLRDAGQGNYRNELIIGRIKPTRKRRRRVW